MISLPDYINKKIIIVFSIEGEKLSFKNDNLIVTNKEGKIKCQYTCYKIYMVYIIGSCTITSGLIDRSKRFGFSIILTTQSLKVYERLNSKMEGNTLLRNKQYTMETFEIAKKIIQNKIENEKLTIEKIRNKSDFQKSSINDLKKYLSSINTAPNLTVLIGIEGNAAKVYFKSIFESCNWNGRKPRVKNDINNFLLDMGYTMLFNLIESNLYLYGFDVYQGVLHKRFYQRKSLVCDIIEPFRCIIDYKIKKAWSLKQIDENDFQILQNKYTLNWNKNSKYVKLFLEEILNHKEEIFIHVQQYYRWIMKEKEINLFPKYKI